MTVRAHAVGSDLLRLDPIGQLPRVRREKGLHQGLGHHDQAGAQGAQVLDVLQIEADEKGDRVGRAIVDEGCRVRKGEDAVVPEEAPVEYRALRLRLPVKEKGEPCEAGQKAEHSRQVGEQVKTAHDRDEADTVDGRAYEVDMLSGSLGPFALELPEDQAYDGQAQGAVDEEYAPPSQCCVRKPPTKGPAERPT